MTESKDKEEERREHFTTRAEAINKVLVTQAKDPVALVRDQLYFQCEDLT